MEQNHLVDVSQTIVRSLVTFTLSYQVLCPFCSRAEELSAGVTPFRRPQGSKGKGGTAHTSSGHLADFSATASPKALLKCLNLCFVLVYAQPPQVNCMLFEAFAKAACPRSGWLVSGFQVTQPRGHTHTLAPETLLMRRCQEYNLKQFTPVKVASFQKPV